MKKWMVAILLMCAVIPLHAQSSDSERFAEGRIALDKYKDCKGAFDALQKVSAAGQKNSMWIYYMAKANECAGNLPQALSYYKAYAAKNSSPEITEKIGDLQYRADKAAEAQRVSNDYSGLWKFTTCVSTTCGDIFRLVEDARNHRISFIVNSADPTAKPDYVGSSWARFGIESPGKLKRILYINWADPDKVNASCPGMTNGTIRPYVIQTLQMSDDGQSMNGSVWTSQLSYETCKITEQYAGPLTLVRVNE